MDTLLVERYRVEGTLGSGGVADVYDALDERLERHVAVKVLRGVNDTRAARRMAGEMSVLAQLNHPSIVRLFDAGEYEGAPFLVMERVDGPPLSGLLQDRPLEERRIQPLAIEVAEALRHAHRKGIVHRDVKPSNILFDSQEQARLSDFGTAWIASTTRATETGGIVGTPAYVAPEQLQGQQVGPSADIYSFGLVLLECWTGRQEFAGTVVEAAMARLARDPEVPADLPGGWTDLLTAMTARAPQDRPTTAQVLAELRSPRRAEAMGAPATDTTQVLSAAEIGGSSPTTTPHESVQRPRQHAATTAARPGGGRRRGGRVVAVLAVVAAAAVLAAVVFITGENAGTPSPAGPDSGLPAPLEESLDRLDETVRP